MNFLHNFYPRYLLPILPIFTTLAVIGISNIKVKLLKIFTFFIIIVASFYSLFNYYNGREYHNNVYLDPWREVTAYIKANSQPNDMIILVRPNIPFEYYYNYNVVIPNIYSILLLAKKGNNGMISIPQMALDMIKSRYKRIWFIKNAPGLMLPVGITDEELELNSDRFIGWLDTNFKLIKTKKYFKDKYAHIKREFINKIFIDYRITVSLYTSFK